MSFFAPTLPLVIPRLVSMWNAWPDLEGVTVMDGPSLADRQASEVLAAGWAQANHQPDASIRTSMAKVVASDAARLIARTSIQSHGAIAYTVEYDLHLAPSWGSPASHRDRLAEALGLTAE